MRAIRILALIGAVVLSSPIARAAWPQQAKLTADDGAGEDYFGRSVSIDGDCAVVGAYGDDDNGSTSGSAYIFQRTGAAWTQQAKLLPDDGAAHDSFGCSVSVSGDYAVVGAVYDDDNGDGSGSAYIFQRSGSAWAQQAKLTADDGAEWDKFAYSVSISGDYAVVGAYCDDDSGDGSGSAYIFQKTGSSWTQQAKLTANDGDSRDYFGISVSIDGDYAVVGAHCDDDNGDFSGSAYIFHRTGSEWTQMAKLTADDGAEGDNLGYSVSIDGDYAVVGAYQDDDNGNASGSAYIFQKSAGGWEDMTQTAKLTADDGAASDYFGYSVAVSGDCAVVGAVYDDDNGSASGSAYIFEKPDGGWEDMTQTAKLTPDDAASEDHFGWSVAVSGDSAVVGAIYDDDNALGSGSAYVFVVPEPASAILLMIGSVLLVRRRRRK